MTTTTEQTPGNDTHREFVSVLPLVNQFDYRPYAILAFGWPIMGKMTSTTKPEVYNALQYRHRRTEPRLQLNVQKIS